MIQTYTYDFGKTARTYLLISGLETLVKNFQRVLKNTFIYQVFLVLISNTNITAKGGER